MKMKKIFALGVTMVMMISVVSGCRPAAKPSAPAPVAGAPAAEGETPEPIVIKIGHTDTSSRSTHTWSEWLGEFLEERAPGRFIVEVYPDGQLGDAPDLAAGVKLGTVTMAFDMAPVVGAASGDKAAYVSCVDLPFLYPTYEDWEQGTFENGGLELFNEALEGTGYYCLGMYYNGMRHLISKEKIYTSPADLKGQKVRVIQNELAVETLKAMGANPTPMAWGEVLTAMSQGALESLDHSLGVFNDFNFDEMCKYLTLTNHASSPFPVVCSSEWFNSLPEDMQALVQEGVTLMCEEQRKEERANEVEYIKGFEANGVTVHELTPEEIAGFQEAVKPVYDLWATKVGQETIDKWLATVPK